MILYLFGCPYNFFQKETNFPFILSYLLFVGFQLTILFYQSKLGPRFFVPLELRRDSNAHIYFFKFARARGANDPERAQHQEEEHIECVICMNKICYEVDWQGLIVSNETQS